MYQWSPPEIKIIKFLGAPGPTHFGKMSRFILKFLLLKISVIRQISSCLILFVELAFAKIVFNYIIKIPKERDTYSLEKGQLITKVHKLSIFPAVPSCFPFQGRDHQIRSKQNSFMLTQIRVYMASSLPACNRSMYPQYKGIFCSLIRSNSITLSHLPGHAALTLN